MQVGLSGQSLEGFMGARLTKRRTDVQLRQEDLAHSAGISLASLKEAEAGRKRLSAEAIVNLASVLDVPPSWFFPSDDLFN